MLCREVKVAVDVWGSAEVPHQIRAFDLPNVPDAVTTDVEIPAVTGDEKRGEEVFLLDGLDGCVDIIRSETREHAAHGFEEGGLLVPREGCNGETGNVGCAREDDSSGLLGPRFGIHQQLGALGRFERRYEGVKGESLIPERVPFVVLRFPKRLREVAIEEGAIPKAFAVVGVGIAAAGDVVSGVDELEVSVVGRAKKGDGGGIFDVTHEVFLDLPVHFFAKIGGVEGFEDLFNEVLLIGSEEGVKPLLGTDVPPVADEIAFRVIDGEADALALRFGETFVKLHRQRVFAGCEGPRHCGCEGGSGEEAEDIAA